MNDAAQQPTLEQAIYLKNLFESIYDENLKLKNKAVYSKEIVKLNTELEKIGISSKLSPKQIELKLQQLYELLVKLPKFKDQKPNDMPANTTLNKNQSADLIEKAAKKSQQNAEIVEQNKRIVEDYIQKSEELIKKAKAAEAEIKKLKEWNIKIEATNSVNFYSDEQMILEDYRREILEEKEGVKEKLAEQIRQGAEQALKIQGLEAEEINYVAIKTAEKITDEIKASTYPGYLPTTAKLAINNSVLEKINTTPIDGNVKEVLLSSIGTTTKFRMLPEIYIKNVTEAAFGSNIANTIFGTNYNVLISEEQIPGQNYKFNFFSANTDGIQILEQQNQSLELLKNFGQQEARDYIFNQSSVYFSNSSVGRGLLVPNSKVETLFYSTFKNAGKTITWTSDNFIGNAVLRYAPEYAPILNIATGSKFVTPIVSMTGGFIGSSLAAQAAATTTSVTLTGGIMAGEAFAGGVGAAAGSVVPIVGTAIGAAAGAAIGALFGNLISKIKTWWTENKDSFGPGIGIGAGIAGAFAFGAGPGILIGLGAFGLIAGTAGLAGLFSGFFSTLGFIGSSLGLAIATPVIITLLVIPPLVAFIMLVINNSAYVVPPSLRESNFGRITSPYIDTVKTANPAGPFKNTDIPKEIEYTITIKAKKGGLTNIKIVDTCEVISKSPATCPKFELPDPPESISPTSPFSFTYKALLDAKYKDSVVINNIVVTADAVGQSGTTAEISNSITIGNPPISCPVPGAKPDNPMNYSYNSANDTGHGSHPYWEAMGNAYSYSLPQSTGCKKPGDCPYYGYAYDVFPHGTTEVFAPSVLGKDTTWNCSYAFSNGGGAAGYTFHCTSLDGNYLLVLTHMNKNAKTGTIKSGEKIGSLFNQHSNTHLHLEFQLNGKWQKPENYFCK